MTNDTKCTTIGIPTDMILPLAKDIEYTLKSDLPIRLFDDLVSIARLTFVNDAYDTFDSLYRGKLSNIEKECNKRWQPRPNHKNLLHYYAKKYKCTYKTVEDVDLSIYWKRCKETIKNPANSEQYIIFFYSDMDNKGMWFDVTRSDDSVRQHMYEKIPEAVKHDENLEKKCTTCGNIRDHILTCGSCMNAKYCNVTCQKRDWKVHKLECNKY